MAAYCQLMPPSQYAAPVTHPELAPPLAIHDCGNCEIQIELAVAKLAERFPSRFKIPADLVSRRFLIRRSDRPFSVDIEISLMDDLKSAEMSCPSCKQQFFFYDLTRIKASHPLIKVFTSEISQLAAKFK